MSFGRICECCGRRMYLDKQKQARTLEVCFMHGPEIWVCLTCYFKLANHETRT